MKTNNFSHQKQVTSLVLTGFILSLILTGCGKNESTGGTFGAATGALAGVALSGKKSRGEGALIGALVGTCLGSAVGRSADEEEEKEERQHERMMARNQINALEAENRALHQKWCKDCNRQFDLVDAHTCPSCGGELIRERYCRECTTKFSPRSGYKYCPHCKDKVLLSCR